jgi:predicted nucleic acid-binding protein
MTFTDLPDGVSLFLDANPFVYHFAPDPVFGPACTSLMERIGRREVLGWTSTHVLSDAGHRLMTLEACSMFGRPITGIAARLKRHPPEIMALTRFQQSIEAIPPLGIQVLPITTNLVLAATEVSQRLGLLSGDALIVALMQDQGLTHLASHDADFDRVPGLTRYAPA